MPADNWEPNGFAIVIHRRPDVPTVLCHASTAVTSCGLSWEQDGEALGVKGGIVSSTLTVKSGRPDGINNCTTIDPGHVAELLARPENVKYLEQLEAIVNYARERVSA